MSERYDEPDDFYSRVDYRRVVAWPERIRRESPFLLETLKTIPSRSVLDLGCGTGEHARFLAERGFQVTGVDCSEAMLAKARETEAAGAEFLKADLRELGQQVKGRYGAAISLGNTLVHLTEAEAIQAFFQDLSALLTPDGVFLFQILNYERIFDQKVRCLPVNFRDDQGEQIVFLRLMELLPDRRVLFCPSTLRFNPAQPPHLEVVKSKAVQLRGWTLAQLGPWLEKAGFGIENTFGDMGTGPFLPAAGPFLPAASTDLVVVCRRRREFS